MALTAAASLNSCSDLASQSSTSQVKKTTPKVSNTTTVSSYSKAIGKDKHGMSTYSDGSRTRYVRATAYSHMEKEVGAPGRKTASMTILKYGKVRSVAADWSRLPLGTKFKIKGKPGITYVVDDYGSALVGTNTIDMFYPTLKGMRNWGTRNVTIQIIQMGSWERSARLLKGRTKYKHCRKMYYAIQSKLNKSKYVKN